MTSERLAIAILTLASALNALNGCDLRQRVERLEQERRCIEFEWMGPAGVEAREPQVVLVDCKGAGH